MIVRMLVVYVYAKNKETRQTIVLYMQVYESMVWVLYFYVSDESLVSCVCVCVCIADLYWTMLCAVNDAAAVPARGVAPRRAHAMGEDGVGYV